MRPKQAVTSLVDFLQSNLLYPVRTSMQEDSNPRPVVVIDNWVREDKNLHNTAFRGSKNDENGDPDKVVSHYYYDLRVDFMTRATSEEEAYDVSNSLENLLLHLSKNPQALHEDINELNYSGANGVNPQHSLESSEAEVVSRIDISSFRTVERDESRLEVISTDTTYN